MELHKQYNPITAQPYRRDRTYVEVSPCKELSPYIKCFWGSYLPYEDIIDLGEIGLKVERTRFYNT